MPTITPELREKEFEKKILAMLDDPRTGLKESSDTNKTRYGILGEIEMYAAEREALARVEERKDIWNKLRTIKQWIFTAPYGLEIDTDGTVLPRKREDAEYLKWSDILALLTQTSNTDL